MAFYETCNGFTALHENLLQRISPKSAKKYENFGNRFIYAHKYGMTVTGPILRRVTFVRRHFVKSFYTEFHRKWTKFGRWYHVTDRGTGKRTGSRHKAPGINLQISPNTPIRLYQREHVTLTLILLTWTIWRVPTNASKWRMRFNPYPENVDNMASSYQR